MRQNRVVPLIECHARIGGVAFVVCGLRFVAYMNPSSVDLQGAIPRVIKRVHEDVSGRLRRGGTALLARIGLLNALELRGAARLRGGIGWLVG